MMNFLIILGVFLASACGAIVGHFIGLYSATRLFLKMEKKQKEEIRRYHQNEKDALEDFVNQQKKLLVDETIRYNQQNKMEIKFPKPEDN